MRLKDDHVPMMFTYYLCIYHLFLHLIFCFFAM